MWRRTPAPARTTDEMRRANRRAARFGSGVWATGARRRTEASHLGASGASASPSHLESSHPRTIAGALLIAERRDDETTPESPCCLGKRPILGSSRSIPGGLSCCGVNVAEGGVSTQVPACGFVAMRAPGRTRSECKSRSPGERRTRCQRGCSCVKAAAGSEARRCIERGW